LIQYYGIIVLLDNTGGPEYRGASDGGQFLIAFDYGVDNDTILHQVILNLRNPERKNREQ